jgi:hypothetical protein
MIQKNRLKDGDELKLFEFILFITNFRDICV